MCGILTHLGREKITPEHPALEVVRHRGPDGKGAVNFDIGNDGLSLGLGHRRLAIIDLSARASQPMFSPDGSVCIVFNGEIYNYIELRDELKCAGVAFSTDSDTEVLLGAYQHWGVGCLPKLNGIFAFAVYDKRKSLLLIARDHFGVKPLCYHNSPDGFTAASEIKQLAEFPYIPHKINKEKLFHFLNSGDFSFDKETMWGEVYELPPGHYMEIPVASWRPGEPLPIKQWYDPSHILPFKGTFDDACEKYLELLKSAIELQLRADVPIGFLLSGGLDSTTMLGLCAAMHPNRGELLKSFSSCYDVKEFDEREYIDTMIAHAKISSSLHFPTPEESAENLDKVIWHNDIPVHPRSAVSHWLLYKHIKEDNDSRIVILEGQGADEVFCGYADFFWPFMLENVKRLRLGVLLREAMLVRRNYGYSWKVYCRKFLRTVFPASAMNLPPNESIHLPDLLAKESSSALPVPRETSSILEMHMSRLVILRYILHNVDRNSMAHSRETRVPFLDHRLVEFALSLPSEYKIGKGFNKLLNRVSVGGIVPEKIRWRRDKQGYSSPISVWAGRELKDFFSHALSQAAEMPFVDKTMIMNRFQRYVQGECAFDPFWWRLVAADRWIKLFRMN